MSAPAASRSLTPASLHRAGLLMLLLALIAGIFGMHLLTGTPGISGAVTEPGPVALQTLPGQAPTQAGHAVSQAAEPAPPASCSSPFEPSPCFDFKSCATMAGMDAACIPSHDAASLAAPPPGLTSLAVLYGPVAIVPAPESFYVAGSPSPGDLSISRT